MKSPKNNSLSLGALLEDKSLDPSLGERALEIASRNYQSKEAFRQDLSNKAFDILNKLLNSISNKHTIAISYIAAVGVSFGEMITDSVARILIWLLG